MILAGLTGMDINLSLADEAHHSLQHRSQNRFAKSQDGSRHMVYTAKQKSSFGVARKPPSPN
jgi:hypothetical protein